MITHEFDLSETDEAWISEGGVGCTLRFTSLEFEETPTIDVDRLVLRQGEHVIFSGVLRGWQIGSEVDIWGTNVEMEEEIRREMNEG